MHWGDMYARWGSGAQDEAESFDLSYCSNCEDWCVWLDGNLIHPTASLVEDPNDDLPEEVKSDYQEAAEILQRSPRGAAALLRLAVQKLVNQLVEGSDDLNTKIGTLVSNGLDNRVQMSLDAVRVIGNEAVHPGQIDLNDSPDVANQLFKLINLIGRRMITEPAEIEIIYATLPPAKLKGIADRDNKTS